MGTSPLQGTHTFSANIFYVEPTVGSTYNYIIQYLGTEILVSLQEINTMAQQVLEPILLDQEFVG